MVLSALILVFTLFYGVFVLRSYFGLFKIEKPKTRRQFFVSIVVPARNEERKIGKCLDTLFAQDYAKDKYEIIVVNDGSTDRTREIVEAYQRRQTEVRLIIITIDDCLARTTAHKKSAIRRGIEVSKGDIILTTDADSIQSGGWIQEMVNHFEEDVGFVSGPVMYTNEKTLFHRLRHLNFLASLLLVQVLLEADIRSFVMARMSLTVEKYFTKWGASSGLMVSPLGTMNC